MKNTLIVMGSHPRTRDQFDWTREDCDIVVFNEAMKMDWCKRADYVMQMHLPVIFRNPGNRNDPNHYNWLKSGKTPIILMQEQYDDVPMSRQYPLDEVLKLGHRYLTSSAAYSIAFGIVEGYERIEIYGVEMETNTEYQHQRPGVAYWVGLAQGAGVEVDFHGNLLDCPLYGYEGDIKFPYKFFDERIKEIDIPLKEAFRVYNEACDRANDLIVGYLKTGLNHKELIDLLQKQSELGANFGLQRGAQQEIIRYKKKADVQIAATGDHLFSRQEFEFSAATFVKDRDLAIITATDLGKKCEQSFQIVLNTGNAAKKKNRMDQFVETVAKYVQESIKVGLFDGAAKENKYLMAKLDELVRMAGGEASKEVMEAAIENRA
ncbi:MAG: hypothetical protein WC107_05620 [Patescibacteria group bacterium]|jgi:hypothetical protein